MQKCVTIMTAAELILLRNEEKVHPSLHPFAPLLRKCVLRRLVPAL